MSDPTERGREEDQPDELELDSEAIRDLDVEDREADAVRGGPCMHSYGSVVQP
jgi:hypothetical protein